MRTERVTLGLVVLYVGVILATGGALITARGRSRKTVVAGAQTMVPPIPPVTPKKDVTSESEASPQRDFWGRPVGNTEEADWRAAMRLPNRIHFLRGAWNNFSGSGAAKSSYYAFGPDVPKSDRSMSAQIKASLPPSLTLKCPPGGSSRSLRARYSFALEWFPSVELDASPKRVLVEFGREATLNASGTGSAKIFGADHRPLATDYKGTFLDGNSTVLPDIYLPVVLTKGSDRVFRGTGFFDSDTLSTQISRTGRGAASATEMFFVGDIKPG